MSKFTVSELANEFGVPADEVVGLLRQMDIPVRSHMSMLSDDQVARIRARWEREKRVRAERTTSSWCRKHSSNGFTTCGSPVRGNTSTARMIK